MTMGGVGGFVHGGGGFGRPALPDQRPGRPWGIVLAAGEGRRLQELTTFGGRTVPKQFCSVGGEESLLELALRRAWRIFPSENVVPVVAAEHHRWWRSELKALAPDQIVVQPSNRGTAAGVLLPLLRILGRDPQARVVLLPADHHVADEWTLTTAVFAALAAVERNPLKLYLLGIEPDRPDPGLGWIVPGRTGETLEPAPVVSFREKPPAPELGDLLARGAVVNTLILAASGTALLAAFRETLPALVELFLQAEAGSATAAALERLYADLPVQDFSQEVLQRIPEKLEVIRVPPCGWSDLGTPERIARCFPGTDGPRGRSVVSLVRPPAQLRRAPVRAARAAEVPVSPR